MKNRFRRFALTANNLLLNNHYVQSTAGLVLVFMGTKLFNMGYLWIGWPMYYVGWFLLMYMVFVTLIQLVKIIGRK